MLSILSDNFGSILVALVSVISVLATNYHATRMRRRDAEAAQALEVLKHETSAADRLYEDRRDALFDFQTQAILTRNELGLIDLLHVVTDPPVRKRYDYGPLDCASYRAQTYCSMEGAAAAESLRKILHVAPHAPIEGVGKVSEALGQWNKAILSELKISFPSASSKSTPDKSVSS